MKKFEVVQAINEKLDIDMVKRKAISLFSLPKLSKVNVIYPKNNEELVENDADLNCFVRQKSLDARSKLVYRYQIEAYMAGDSSGLYKLPDYKDVHNAKEAYVIGAGPAGIFAALRLLMQGIKPIIIERGKEVKQRSSDIAALTRDGILNEESNYCFGEGGAGTFSDGKLYTRSSKRGDIREVLYQLVDFGADANILIDAHPHIGSNRLPRIMFNIRQLILSKGGEYHFETKLIDIRKEAKYYKLITMQRGEERVFDAKAVILACGHSATEIYELFNKNAWALSPKGFALGLRVEHPQSLINDIRYRGMWHNGMAAAEYSFVKQLEDKKHVKRGVFSFCMCPGGILVPSTTSKDKIVSNGMSNSSRSSKWANAGVVVQINPEDVPKEYLKYGALSLLRFQEDVEKKIFDYTAKAGLSNPFAAPAQRMIDFCKSRLSKELPETSYQAGVVSAPLHDLLPDFVVQRLQKVFPLVDKQGMRGYYTNDALLLAVESRTSSAVRINRLDNYQAPDLEGIYPCGEGAGYAGGIVSSAIDGINCALALSEYINAI